jgi:hypothetical protein
MQSIELILPAFSLYITSSELITLQFIRLEPLHSVNESHAITRCQLGLLTSRSS